jgi:hypothetical protein
MDSDFCQREKGVEANLNNIPAAIMDTERIDGEIRGELVPQDPTDEPAAALLKRIRAHSQNGASRKRRRG